MSNDLFTATGKRKYLTSEERNRFIAAANSHERGEVRALCLVLAYTGCRISEALQLTADRVDLSAKAITFRTLKQRGRASYRAVPVPDSTLLMRLNSFIASGRPRKEKAAGRMPCSGLGAARKPPRLFLLSWTAQKSPDPMPAPKA